EPAKCVQGCVHHESRDESNRPCRCNCLPNPPSHPRLPHLARPPAPLLPGDDGSLAFQLPPPHRLGRRDRRRSHPRGKRQRRQAGRRPGHPHAPRSRGARRRLNRNGPAVKRRQSSPGDYLVNRITSTIIATTTTTAAITPTTRNVLSGASPFTTPLWPFT